MISQRISTTGASIPNAVIEFRVSVQTTSLWHNGHSWLQKAGGYRDLRPDGSLMLDTGSAESGWTADTGSVKPGWEQAEDHCSLGGQQAENQWSLPW